MHDIFGTRFVGARIPAWHHIGTVIQNPEEVTIGEMLKVGGIDYLYQSAPIGFTSPSGNFVGSKKVAVLRSPVDGETEWVELGIVSEGYRYLQNEELARGLDAVARETGWTFETVGALANGAQIFMTLSMGGISIKGDELNQYLIVSDGKASGRSLQVSIATERVVCRNTLLAADASATTMIKIAHDAEVANNYGFWTEYIADFKSGRERTIEELNRMADVRVTLAQAQEIIAAAFPLPKPNAKAKQAQEIADDPKVSVEMKERALERLLPGTVSYQYEVDATEKKRAGALELLGRFNDGAEQGGSMAPDALAALAGTGYAVLQAVTEVVDWAGAAPAAGAAGSALFGDGAIQKRRAWEAALAVAN